MNNLLKNKLNTEVLVSLGITSLRSVGSLISRLKTDSFDVFRFLRFLKTVSIIFNTSYSCPIYYQKLKNYINFKNFTHTKLNSLTVLECETPKTYYLFFKEQLIILSEDMRNTFNYFKRTA